jgi:DMSO/TMAO reductase YedYZ molybdopterin-dependent catalytic subunit
MFWMDEGKVQAGEIPTPEGLAPDVIISPDTRRAGRIPPGQSRTKKWPVLDASGPPSIDLASWRLRVSVTRWSRLGNVWEGVSTRELVRQAGGVLPAAAFVMAYGYDRGWRTNLPLEGFLSEDALVAFHHDGEPITAEHGGPARLIVPQLYAWKSAKWLAGIEIMDRKGRLTIGLQATSLPHYSMLTI